MRMEHWWFTARLRLRSILLGRRVERELDVASHSPSKTHRTRTLQRFSPMHF